MSHEFHECSTYPQEEINKLKRVIRELEAEVDDLRWRLDYEGHQYEEYDKQLLDKTSNT